jgi:hypothetical protein
MSEELFEHSVAISPTQITKMKKGLNVTLNPKHFSEAGSHIISVMPMNHKRILPAIRRGKGLKINLSPVENLYKKTTGGKISLKGIGRTINKGLHNFGHKVEGGLKQVGKVVAKPMVDALIQGGIPAVTGIAGEVLGGPMGGIAGSVAGQALANQVQRQANKRGLGLKKPRKSKKPMGGDLIHIDLDSHNGDEKEGKGLFRTLHKLGVSKRKTINTFKKMGRNALKLGAEAVTESLNAAGVNPNITGPLIGSLEHIGEEAINKGSVKGFKQAGHKSVAEIKKVAKEQALGYLDKKLDSLPPEIRDIAESALDRVEMKEGVSVHPESEIMGTGANVYGSLPYRTAMKRIKGGAIKNPMVNGATGEMTLSPYQSYHSPAMHPFIPHTNELQGYNPIKGGSIYPAGYKRGGSFVPSG